MRKFSLIVLSFLLISFQPSVHAAVGDINTFAGTDPVTFSGDGGSSLAAQLNVPTDIAVDSDRNIYIADLSNHRIRKVDFATGIISTFAGTGIAGFNGDGVAVNAQLNQPIRIAFDSHDNLFVADSQNHRVRKIAPNGIMTTVAGTGIAGFSGDGGPATHARLFFPLDVAVDTDDNLYIADHTNSRIRKVDTNNRISTVAGSGIRGFSGDGYLATHARLNYPNSVAVDASGNIYIADTNNHRIRKVDVNIGYIDTIAGNGSPGLDFNDDDNPAINAMLNSPRGVAITDDGRVIIADSDNHLVRRIELDGTIGTINTLFHNPYGVFFFDETLLIADSDNHRIQMIFNNAIATIAGAPRVTFNGDNGPAIDAQLYDPTSIAFDSLGNRYIADSSNHRIRKITPVGVISTIAGLDIDGNAAGFSGDDGSATSAQLSFPTDIAIDTNNNLFFSDSGNHRIRKITPLTPGGDITPEAIISTVAGDGTLGFSGDNGATGSATSAQLHFPTGIAIDSSNNLLFTDSGNHRIRRITPDGIISTIAGSEIGGNAAGFSGDGGAATSAQLNQPMGLTVDSDGNVFIADNLNNRIRKIDSLGDISTIAGAGTAGFSGDGGIATAATLNHPTDVALTAYGNLLISDNRNQRIRHLSSDDIITTIAGNGNIAVNNHGDGGQATQAILYRPANIAVDADNILYIADVIHNRVRTVVLNTPPTGTDNTITIDEDATCIYFDGGNPPEPLATPKCTFDSTDFGFHDSDTTHTLSSIKITSLVSAGTLQIDGVDVTLNQVIRHSNIGKLTFKSAPNQFGINHDSFQFTVNDGFNNSKQSNTITINVTPVNDAPVISGTPLFSVNEDSSYSFRASATDIENDAITFSISNKPNWLLFNSVNGQLFGSPDNSQVGTYNNIIITATDKLLGSSSLPPFSITVHNVNDAPTVNGNPPVHISIVGDHREDTYLNVDTRSLEDADGLGPFRYLWLRNGIHVGSSSSYLLGDADVEQTISVVINYTDRRGTDQSIPADIIFPEDPLLTHPPINAGTITSVNDAPTGAVTIAGLPHIGETLTVENTLNDADGLGSFSYEWTRSGTVTPVGTSSSYLIGDADENQTLTVTISYTDGQGTMESISSNATALIIPTPDPNQDSDGDGMSDAFETEHGLNPAINDAAGDLDGDGVSNYQEFLNGSDPTKDDYPPTDITIPENIIINSTGLLTADDLGIATAIDGKDGAITPTPDNGGPFSPGSYVISWTATDAAGNSATAAETQTVNVIPMVNFAIDQISEEGIPATVSVHLNGAVTSDLTIPFTLSGSGTADSADHDLALNIRTISIPAGEASGSVTFNILSDVDTGLEDETLIFTMGALTGVVAGSKTSHTITITEQNLAPRISLKIEQTTPDDTSIVIANADPVTITATVIDANASTTLIWTASDNSLSDTDGELENSTFLIDDASNLSVGTYSVVVEVTDGDDGLTKYSQKHAFKVIASTPVDEDDNAQDYKDSDNDGIANYLDQIPLSYAVALQQEDQSRHIVETQPGLTLRLGAIAFESETNGIQVSETAIERYATSIRFPKDDHQNIGGLFDFEIHGLSQAGNSALMVIPLRKVIPAKPRYRKLMPTGWQDFITDEKNSLASAPGENGICPPPNDSAYTSGLTSGHHCVQLRIEDGGPNDADGVTDGVIIDPGGVAIEPTVNERDAPDEVTPLPALGGGVLNASYLLLILVWLLFFSHRRYKQAR